MQNHGQHLVGQVRIGADRGEHALVDQERHQDEVSVLRLQQRFQGPAADYDQVVPLVVDERLPASPAEDQDSGRDKGERQKAIGEPVLANPARPGRETSRNALDRPKGIDLRS